MTRRPAALALVAVFAVAACGGYGGGAPTATAAPPAPTAAPPAATTAPAGRDYGTTTSAAPATAAPVGGAETAVAIENFAFAPADLVVPAGTTVTWTNSDSAPHSVVSSNGGFANSSTLAKGGSYSVTFPTAGTFAYVCGIHSSMRATITVTP